MEVREVKWRKVERKRETASFEGRRWWGKGLRKEGGKTTAL